VNPASRTRNNLPGATAAVLRPANGAIPPPLLDPGDELLAGLMVVTEEMRQIAQNIRHHISGSM
jgi:hypothetical protein